MSHTNTYLHFVDETCVVIDWKLHHFAQLARKLIEQLALVLGRSSHVASTFRRLFVVLRFGTRQFAQRMRLNSNQ